jgi:hypothetical protein
VSFLVEPQNQGQTIYLWFDLKTTGTIFSGLTSKLVVTVSPRLVSKLAVEGLPV